MNDEEWARAYELVSRIGWKNAEKARTGTAWIQ